MTILLYVVAYVLAALLVGKWIATPDDGEDEFDDAAGFEEWQDAQRRAELALYQPVVRSRVLRPGFNTRHDDLEQR